MKLTSFEFSDTTPGGLIAITVGFILGIIPLWVFLAAMFYREQVKQDLGARVCQPLLIRWKVDTFFAASFACQNYKTDYK